MLNEGDGDRNRSRTVPPDQLTVGEGAYREPVTFSGIFPKEFSSSFEEGLMTILQLHPHAVSVFEIPKGGSFGKVLLINPNFESLFGYAAEEAMQKSLSDFFHPDETRLHDPRLGMDPVNGSFVLREVRLQTKEGCFVNCDMRGGFGDFGSKRLGIAFIENVAERRQAVEDLERSEERYRVLAESAADAFITIDDQSRIVFANSAAERIFGYSKEELSGRSLTTLMPQEFRERHRAGIQNFARTGEKRVPWEGIELPGQSKDGRRIPLEISFGEYRSGGRQFFNGILRDVTGRKRAEANRIAAERLDVIQVISRGLAHDANNAGAVELTYLDLLTESLQGLTRLAETAAQARSPSKEESFRNEFLRELMQLHAASASPDRAKPMVTHPTEAAEIASKTVDILRNIIEDLNIVKEQSARVQFLIGGFKELTDAPQSGPPFELHTLLGERDIRAILGSGRRLELSLVPEPWQVPGPKDGISRVILNLVGNARDAMEGRETQSLSVETNKVHLSLADIDEASFALVRPEVTSGDYMQLKISDTGSGMDEATRQRIFEPYFSTKTKGPFGVSQDSGHSGLGLAITRKLVRDAGGFITVESERNRGTSFSVYLPRIPGKTPLADSLITEPGAAASPLSGDSLRERIFNTPILIVDDEISLLKIYARSLKRAGFTNAHTAGNAKEALELLGHFPEIGLMITDVGLPDMKGTELLTRAQKSNPHLAYILWTGGDQGVLRPFTGDLTAVLGKPTEIDKLVQTMQQLIANSFKLKR